MSALLRHVVLACALTGTVAGAWAQSRIYSCTDAKGRRLTSDRPIPECIDREQRELSPLGTVRRTIPPTLTPAERALKDEQDRKLAEEQQRQAEEKRMQKLLVSRYPSQQAHDAERAKALQPVDEAIASGRKRIAELQDQQKKLRTQADATKAPPEAVAKLKRQMEDNEHQVAVQARVVATQEEEKARITKRYDEELARLQKLWTQQASAAASAAVPLAR
jgi:chromosome segregation ATPase